MHLGGGDICLEVDTCKMPINLIKIIPLMVLLLSDAKDAESRENGLEKGLNLSSQTTVGRYAQSSL